MLDRYLEELDNLRDLGKEFAQKHPHLAPMFEPSRGDPDVERLLEGVAFLTALLRERLDDDFPEIIQELFQLIWPHCLRPLPSAAIVTFDLAPKANSREVSVPRGTYLDSEEVEGTRCRFKTCFEVVVHPLALERAILEEDPGRPPAICLQLALKGLTLAKWQPGQLRLHVAGEARDAANLYFLLCRHLKAIELRPHKGGETCVLQPDQLRPAGFGPQEALFPYPSQSFPAYRILQEYFILPEKFLFLDLVGWDQWTRRGPGNAFEIRFELDLQGGWSLGRPRVDSKAFALAATPVINLFHHAAEPIALNHRKSEYLVRPEGGSVGPYQVYDITRVTGRERGTGRKRDYRPFEMFSPHPETPTYHARIRPSPLRRALEFHLSVLYPPGPGSRLAETLSMELECTNGRLPEGLKTGDIRHPTDGTPVEVVFQNLRPPTPYIHRPSGGNLQWKLLSHLYLNHRSLLDEGNLQALLRMYDPETNTPEGAGDFSDNLKRIRAIRSVHAQPVNRLVRGVMMRGQEIRLEVDGDRLPGPPGDVFLFGTVLDRFLSLYASMNTFTQLTISEKRGGEESRYQWPARVGDHPLI